MASSRQSGKASSSRPDWGVRSGAGTGSRVGCSIPLSPAFQLAREPPKHEGVCRLGASVLAGLACPASNRRGDAPFANDDVDLARRRRTIPLPSETNDVTTPSVRRIQPQRLAEDFSSRGRSSGDRAVPPSHARTILLRRTSHKKRYFLGHAARRRSSPSTTPLVHALARTSGETSPLLTFGASSGRSSGSSTFDLRSRADLRSRQPFPPLSRSRVTREIQPPEP